MKKKGLLIGEMASLFGLSIDTLRYYDRENLLTPERDPVNGYRFYTIHHISRLISILFLRKIDVPMREIRESIDDYTLENTYHFLKEKKKVISGKIKHLKKLEKMIDNQLKFIDHYSSGTREIKREMRSDTRSVFYIVRDLDSGAFSDDYSVLLSFFTSSSLRAIPEEWFFSGRFGCVYMDFEKKSFHLAYFYDGIRRDADMLLPPGQYASYLHSGGSGIEIQVLKEMKSMAGGGKPILEIWQIDEYHSRREKDFITEYQINLENS